jgi:hypothetical protein
VRGRNAKSYYCPRRVLLWAAHSLPSPISLGHLRNPRQLTPHCPPHLLLVMLLQLQLQQHRHTKMQRYDRLDSGLGSGSLLVVSLLNIQMVVIRSSHPSQFTCLWISPRTLVYADAFRTVLFVFMYDMDTKHSVISSLELFQKREGSSYAITSIMSLTYSFLFPLNDQLLDTNRLISLVRSEVDRIPTICTVTIPEPHCLNSPLGHSYSVSSW